MEIDDHFKKIQSKFLSISIIVVSIKTIARALSMS